MGLFFCKKGQNHLIKIYINIKIINILIKMPYKENSQQIINEKDQEKDVTTERECKKWKIIAIISIIILIIIGIIVFVYFTILNKDSPNPWLIDNNENENVTRP